MSIEPTPPLDGLVICGSPRPDHPGDFCRRPFGHDGRHWTGRPNLDGFGLVDTDKIDREDEKR